MLFYTYFVYFGKTFKDGIDFYFLSKQHALRFITFLEGHVPMQSEYVSLLYKICKLMYFTRYSRKLIGADKKSNVGNYKHNFLVVIAPICKVCIRMIIFVAVSPSSF